MILRTAEVRWFYPGAVPREIHAWLQRAGCTLEAKPARTDHYLRLADEALGVKLREGRLELKQRVDSAGVISLHQRAAGLVERWRKWSFALADSVEALNALLRPASCWIAVNKERALCTVPPPQTPREETPAPASPLQGCNLELTAVRAGRNEWWSLGFEAFGPAETVLASLRRATTRLFTGDEPPTLHAEASYGYPKWLAGLPPPGNPESMLPLGGTS
ncbi:MAG: hypothetical protein JXR37_21015 [Kiritimatiellae bacterium]|nr:hypothetical protein [Kiritimatiellia bacterium]